MHFPKPNMESRNGKVSNIFLKLSMALEIIQVCVQERDYKKANKKQENLWA